MINFNAAAMCGQGEAFPIGGEALVLKAVPIPALT